MVLLRLAVYTYAAARQFIVLGMVLSSRDV